MTVAELKQLLQDYPDDYRVGVVTDITDEDLVFQDFVPLEQHDPGYSKEEKLLLLYLDEDQDA